MLIIASIVMMTVDHHFHHLSKVRKTISVVVYPIEYLAGIPAKVYSWGAESLSGRNKLLRNNAELRAEQIRLELRLQRLATLEQENTRLREMLTSAKYFEKERILIGELLSVDLDPYQQRIVINKGTRDGVYEGQPLLGARGIIGQIDKAGPFNSIALLVSDPNHALLGVIARSGQRSLVVGTGNIQQLELMHLTSTADIQIGDLVITSGLDDRYPSDYPVAEVTSIKQVAGDAFVKVEAKPLVDLNSIREVLLIWPSAADADYSVENNVDNTTDSPVTNVISGSRN
jgi:rod shape-determining protein MreC